jgi:hypothetical protein
MTVPESLCPLLAQSGLAADQGGMTALLVKQSFRMLFLGVIDGWHSKPNVEPNCQAGYPPRIDRSSSAPTTRLSDAP